MKKLLLVGSNSIHTLHFYQLIHSYFEEIKVLCDNEHGPCDKLAPEIIHCSFRTPQKLIGTVRHIRHTIKEFKPDIIHILQIGTTSCCVLRANRRFHIPTVVTALGSDILINPYKSLIHKRLVQYSLRHGNYFTSDSEHMANRMRELSTKTLDITIANFGIETPKLTLPKENIIYSNRLHKPLYRIDHIIRTFHAFSQQHNGWQLVIAGSGEETENLQQLCKTLNMGDSVRFIGWVDSQTNQDFYAKARLWVSIPRSDATSISLLEAMHAGCIPVVSDLPANREWIEDMHNGHIVKDTSLDFLSVALNIDSTTATTANHQLVEQLATKEVNRQKFIEIYQKAKPSIRRICHMSSVHPAKDVRIFIKECRSLAAAGYETYLVVPHTADETTDGVHILSVPKTHHGRRYRMRITTKQVFDRALAVNADLYHLHDPELIPWGLKLKKAGKKVIFDSHENVPLQIMTKGWIPKLLRPLLASFYCQYERWALRQMDALITVNDEIAHRLNRIQPQTAVVTNFPILRQFSPSDTFAQRNKLCFAGNIKDEYRHHLIIQSLEQFKDIQYLLAGIADPTYLNTLKQLPQWKKVDYRGIVPHEQVFNLYNQSLAGICIHAYTPNVGGKNGGLGFIKNFEMMMAGLPIICSKFKVWEEIINRYRCGICVDPDNADEIMQAINYITKHPDEAREMGLRGRKAVEDIYNWESQKKILLNLINSL